MIPYSETEIWDRDEILSIVMKQLNTCWCPLSFNSTSTGFPIYCIKYALVILIFNTSLRLSTKSNMKAAEESDAGATLEDIKTANGLPIAPTLLCAT